MKKERIVAGFRCPICGDEVYAVGFAWRCNRKGCGFTMGRSYKTDPHGTRFMPNKADWQGPRDRYREKMGLPFENSGIVLPPELFYAIERDYSTPGSSDTPFYRATIFSRESLSRGGTTTKYYHETLPKKSKEEALKILKTWLKANGGERIKLIELESKR